MSTITVETLTMPSAALGTDNPLPDIRTRSDLHAQIPIDTDTVTPDESRYMGWGRVNGILPYTIQDGYNRDKQPRAWKAIVLRNSHLQATFLPEIGGRLWSLIDLSTGRELLHRNPVFQPCNLALRNAWVSGGVEWNLGIIGHTPYTVDALHAEILHLKDGTPVLRMYQYERVRRLVYRIEAALPEDSKYLLVRVRIDNPLEEDTAVYWWSNMAVDEREDVRVLVPADKTFRYGYGGKLAKVGVPHYNGWDISHTTQIPQAIDFFFDLPDGQRRWIAALDDTGYGFVQTSTDVLRGRKLFVWGTGTGGRNWQKFLSVPGSAYIELQAGLARTQLEHLPMGPRQTLQWTEAYGALQADAKSVAGADWQAATDAAEVALAGDLSREALQAWDERLAAELDGAAGERVHTGDGWGYVDSRLYGDAFQVQGIQFPEDSVGDAEAQWLALLETGVLPCPNPLLPPMGYQVHPAWRALLEKAIAEGKSGHWYGWYQLGVMCSYAGGRDEARAAFEASLRQARNPWALRCLAVLDEEGGDIQAAAGRMLEAAGMVVQRQLALEAIRVQLDAGRYGDAQAIIAGLPGDIAGLGRVQVMQIEAALALGDLQGAEVLLSGPLDLTDVREGEVSLTDLWFTLQAMKKAGEEGAAEDGSYLAWAKETLVPPAHLDYRMQ